MLSMNNIISEHITVEKPTLVKFWQKYKAKIFSASVTTLIVVLLFLFSGNAYVEFAISKRLEALLLLSLLGISGILFLLNISFVKVKNFVLSLKSNLKNKKTILTLIFWAVFIGLAAATLIINIVSNRGNFTGILRTISVYATIVMLVVTYKKERIIDTFLLSVRILIIASLAVFILSLFLPSHYVTEIYVTKANTLVYNYFHLSYILRSWGYISVGIPRFSSIFWEPSIAAGVLSIALFVRIFYKKHSMFDTFLYVIAVVFTLSTGGIFLFGLLFIYYIMTVLDKREKIVFGSIILVGSIFAFIFRESIFSALATLSPQLFGKLATQSASFLTRLNSLPTFIKIFGEKPIFGHGPFGAITRYYEVIAGSSLDAATSTFGFFIAAFGFIGIFLVALIITAPLFLQEKWTNRIFASLFFIVLLNLQNVPFLALFMLFPVIFILEGVFNKKASLTENNPVNERVYAYFFMSKTEGSAVVKNINGALIIKGLSMIVGIIAIPVYRTFFISEEYYGLWMAIISILTWILFFDFGFGIGLRAKLGPLLDAGEEKDAQEKISSTYVGSIFIALGLLVVFAVLIWSLDLNGILNTPTSLVSEMQLKISMSILAAGFCIEFVLKNVLFVLYSMRKSAIASFVTFLSMLSLLLFFIIFKDFNITNRLLVSSIVYVVCINVPLIVASFVLYARKKALLPTFKGFSLASMKSVMSIGLVFFLIQIGFLFITQTDGLLITSMFSTNANAQYTYYSRIFVFFVGLMGAVVQQPIWSAISAAREQGDTKMINKYIKVTFGIALFLFVICLFIGVGLPFIFELWLGDHAPTVNSFFVIVFLLYSFIFLFSNALIIVANGLTILKSQAVITLIVAALKIPVLIGLMYLLPQLEWSVVVLVTTLCYVPYLIFLPIYIHKMIKKVRHEEKIA